MQMALDGQKVMRAAGAATVAAPYVRRLARDEKLRDDVKIVMDNVRHLYDEVSEEGVGSLVTDEQIRHQVDTILAALQDAGERLMRPRRRTSAWVPVLIIGGGADVGVGAVLAYPPSREALMQMVPMSRPAQEETAETEAAAQETPPADIAQAA
jgi:predicted metal-dependent RNase